MYSLLNNTEIAWVELMYMFAQVEVSVLHVAVM